MIVFESREVVHGPDSFEVACLVTPVSEIQDVPAGISKDGEVLPLDQDIVSALGRAIKDCDAWEQEGFGVDCAVFGTVALGGMYVPISEELYRTGLHRNLHFGRWLHKEEIFGASEEAQLVQFGRYNQGFIPRHTAVKLPGISDSYIQKIGHGLPIAITNAEDNFLFQHTNTVATMDGIMATHNSKAVLIYLSRNPEESPVTTYQSVPG